MLVWLRNTGTLHFALRAGRGYPLFRQERAKAEMTKAEGLCHRGGFPSEFLFRAPFAWFLEEKPRGQPPMLGSKSLFRRIPSSVGMTEPHTGRASLAPFALRWDALLLGCNEGIIRYKFRTHLAVGQHQGVGAFTRRIALESSQDYLASGHTPHLFPVPNFFPLVLSCELQAGFPFRSVRLEDLVQEEQALSARR